MKSKLIKITAALMCAAVLMTFQSGVSAYGKVIFSGADGCGKRIALTFDDGPHPYKTPEILDLLALYDIRATFFVVGQNAGYFPDIVLREAAEGHEIGNHTFHHKCLSKCKGFEECDEIAETSELIRQITGKSPSLLRPPEGVYSSKTVDAAKSNGCDVVLWSVDTRDWALTKTSEIVDNVKSHVKDGSIILFHDFTRDGAHTADALKILIPYLKDSGYEFVTVSQLLHG